VGGEESEGGEGGRIERTEEATEMYVDYYKDQHC
jgi:hypothetical protein